MIGAVMAVSTAPAGAISTVATDTRRARLARFVAMFIDLVVFGILSLVVNNVYGVTQVTSGSPIGVGAGTAFFTATTTVAWPWLIVLWLGYFIVPESLFGASFGKILNGLCVVRVDGAPLGIDRLSGLTELRRLGFVRVAVDRLGRQRQPARVPALERY